MKAYQADIAKFENGEAQVLAISVDKPEKNSEFARSLGLSFPVLSDPQRTISRKYGMLIPIVRLAKRVTFIIDKEGIIQSVERGDEAMDMERTYQRMMSAQQSKP